MEFYFTNDFIFEFKKIIKAKEHQDLEALFIEQVFKQDFDTVLKVGAAKQGGDNNNSAYIKKRIGKDDSGKSGGFRSYIMILIKDEKLYFIFIHPKAGRRAMIKLETKAERKLLKSLRKDKKENNLIQVSINKAEDKIIQYQSKIEIKKKKKETNIF